MAHSNLVQTHSIHTGWINEPLMTLKERVKIKKPMTDSQICIYCGKNMKKGEPSVMLKNHPGSSLTIQKNLWVHKKCKTKFATFVMGLN